MSSFGLLENYRKPFFVVQMCCTVFMEQLATRKGLHMLWTILTMTQKSHGASLEGLKWVETARRRGRLGRCCRFRWPRKPIFTMREVSVEDPVSKWEQDGEWVARGAARYNPLEHNGVEALQPLDLWSCHQVSRDLSEKKWDVEGLKHLIYIGIGASG